MTDSFIQQRAEAILAMMSPADLQAVHLKLKNPSAGNQSATIHSIAIALAEYEKRTGTRTAKIKLVKALSKFI